MASPNETAGGSKKAAASGKNMRRCSHCGAKNKDSFEYCVRCSESLDESGGSWVALSERRSPMVTIIAASLVGIFALGAVALVTRSSEEEPAPPAATRTRPTLAQPSERRGEPILADIDSKEVLAMYNEGLRAYSEGDYDTAIERLTQVVEDIPNNPAVVRYLGLAYYENGEFEDAMDRLEDAHELRPHSFNLMADYVSVCKEGGDVERALVGLERFVADHPDELDARLEIARLARSSGNNELAMAQSEYLATANDLDPEFVYEYGVTLRAAGQVEEAKAVLKNSIELDPESAVAHHALGVVELDSGNASKAVGSLEEAVAREPANGDFRFSLAQAYEKLDRVEESLDAYDAYLEHARPDDARAKVVRRQLAIAKKALAAEHEQRRQGRSL
jgi:tetratricopeptide (TPR) repeat protein